jgi:hypothetical protein
MQAKWKSTPSGPHIVPEEMPLLGNRRPLCFCSQLRFYGHDAPIHTERKETVAARGASICGNTKQSKQPCEGPLSVLTRNALQIQIAAQSAVRISHVGDGNGPRIKPQITRPTPPGPQQSSPNQIIPNCSSAGTMGTVAMTARTKQCSSPLVISAESIREGQLWRQVPYWRYCSTV